jgi:very-short-patch-repair endonuclease
MLPEINLLYALVFFGGAVLVLGAILYLVTRLDSAKELKLEFRKKEFVMTDRERIWFTALVSTVGPSYYVFPQIHFDQLAQPTSTDRRQKFGDRGRIAQKSVDFVVCAHDLRTVLAIEIDDRTHDSSKKMGRDQFQNALFADIGLPLVRFRHEDPKNMEAIAKQLQPYLQREIQTRTEAVQ